jgi:serine/threonine protein kinase
LPRSSGAIQDPSGLPKRIGKYQILKKMATGGMAEIYIAVARGIEGFEKLVVLKRILPQLASNPSFVNMFLDEARIAATLQHPNVVQVYDIENVDNNYLFSMEYLHGADLHKIGRSLRQKRRGLPIDQAIAIMLGATAGLHYAHDKRGIDGKHLGIVHRDVSPQNIIVTYDGTVKLVDFGIAKAVHRSTQTKNPTLKGKVRYMSPEQCRSRPLDRRSDVFSASIILWELTTGQKLFARESEYDSLRAIVDSDAPPPLLYKADYPMDLQPIVMKGLARNPDDRWQNANELHRALEDFARERKLHATPAGLQRFMRDIFGEQIESWVVAQKTGKSLAQHVSETLDRVKPDDDEDTQIRTVTSVGPAKSPPPGPATVEMGPPRPTTTQEIPAPPPLFPPPEGAPADTEKMSTIGVDESPTVKDMIAAEAPPEDGPSITSTSFVKPGDMPGRRLRWPLFLVGGVIAMGAGAIIAWQLGLTEKEMQAPAADAAPAALSAPPALDAAPIVKSLAPPDAAVPDATPIDAAAPVDERTLEEIARERREKRKKKKQQEQEKGDDDDLDSLRP